ncbi:MAG: DUF5998 family protein [Propionibacteriaceae bacterium]
MTDSIHELRDDVAACGYFPDLISEGMELALGDELLVRHLVHHEATFSEDSLHRHLTVLGLTDTRLVVSHTDEHTIDLGPMQAASTTEVVSLDAFTSVSLTRIVSHPEKFGSTASRVEEAWLAVGWGTMRRADLEPAGCDDPTCEADHGYTGTLTADDLTVRMSAAADGVENVARLVSFGVELQRRTGRSALTTRTLR